MELNRRTFIGSVTSLGMLSGCRLFTDPTGLFSSAAPKLKVGILSDIHISRLAKPGEGADNFQNELMFVRALEHFRDEGVDAVLIAGDMTECGYIEELEAVGAAWFRVFPDNRAPDGRTVEKLFVCGNHELDGFEYGNRGKKKYPDEAELKRHLLRGNMEAAWERAFREKFTPILDRTLNGFRFVGINWEKPPKGGWALDPSVRLREFLNANGKSLDPSRPFFVFQHPHPRHTCYGDWAWGHDWGDVTKLLSGYPNAVVFSGHSHYPLTDERSVWQGAFTSIGTASLRYTGLPYDEISPIGYENTPAPHSKQEGQFQALKTMPRIRTDSAQGMLMYVYDDRIVLKRRDFRHEAPLGADWVLPLPNAEPRTMAFAPRAAKARPPAFAAGASLAVSKIRAGNQDRLKVVIPAAFAAKDARPYSYGIEVRGEFGEYARFDVLANGFNLPPTETARVTEPTECIVAAGRVAEGRISIEVTPYDCWHTAGRPLKADFDGGRTRYRGMMSPFAPVAEDLKDLAAIGGNLLRYQMTGRGVTPPAKKPETAEEKIAWFDTWSKEQVDRLVDVVLPAARRYGLKVVVDLHTSPGGRDDANDHEVNMYHDAKYAQRFVDFWRETAKRCQPFTDVIYGYDLFNEPHQMAKPLRNCDYWTVQIRAAEAIRTVDRETPVIVTGRFWGGPKGFFELREFPDRNVIYQVHMYEPASFTHQFVAAWCTRGACSYPGVHPVTDLRMDIEYLKMVLKPVRDFQLRYGCRMYVGEFSAVCWAEGAERYIGDVISLMEEYGWDWTMHAWREWPGWSPEHVCTAPETRDRFEKRDNPRLQVVKDAFRGVFHRTKPITGGSVPTVYPDPPRVMPTAD